MRKITVTTQFGQYTVSVGIGIFEIFAKRLHAPTGARGLTFVLTAPEIWVLWGKHFQAAMAPREPIVLFLPAGESFKRMAQVERLATEMAKAGADRSSTLIAFGGGVTGDLGGFLSAIFMRGIDYIQVPTTLLAQVDSSVGGKTAVNLQTGKNLVGAFYPPKEVFVDIALLRTLPQRELRAGVYESIKAGLIRDAALFRFIESHRQQIVEGDEVALEKMVAASVRMKADVVSEDEKEFGVRMHLNFGHTLGHAIEAVSGYRALLHGEAIAWGMIAALHLSLQRDLLSADEMRRITALIFFFRPPPLPALSTKRLLQAASGDKKNRAGVRRFVLLKSLGKAVVVDDVSDAELKSAIAVIRRLSDQHNPMTSRRDFEKRA